MKKGEKKNLPGKQILLFSFHLKWLKTVKSLWSRSIAATQFNPIFEGQNDLILLNK
jgi:hypothetical protein